MQHPFEGILSAASNTSEPKSTRRSMFGRLFGAVAVLLGAGATASAQDPNRRVTTLAYGEEGSERRRRRVTTYALGEESSRPTTYALGEESIRATTYALNEESSRPAPPPSSLPMPPAPPPPPAVPPVPRVPGSSTTIRALGEEGY